MIRTQASEFVQKLRQLIQENGDFEVVNEEDCDVDVEFQEADATMSAAYVIS